LEESDRLKEEEKFTKMTMPELKEILKEKDLAASKSILMIYPHHKSWD
jgi:hypothetical protein